MHSKQNIQNISQTPLISFIITYYNLPADMLIDCVKSVLVLNLTEGEREIIVVDDGSHIKAADILKKYSRYITCIRQDNAGLSAARNHGLEIANGHYIQFLDGDDMLMTNGYNNCINILKKHKPDILMFQMSRILNSKEALSDDTIITSGSEYMLTHNIHAAACGYLFKLEILGNLMFTYGIYHEDEEFTPLLLLQAETLYHTNIKAYWYRCRANSITTGLEQTKIDKRLNDKENVITRLNKHKETLCANKYNALQRRIAQLAMDYIYNIIIDTRCWNELTTRIKRLRNAQLYPLPNESYTVKFAIFKLLANRQLGLRILLHVLPLLKRER